MVASGRRHEDAEMAVRVRLKEIVTVGGPVTEAETPRPSAVIAESEPKGRP
jgi:hypothetical protein